MMAFFLLLWLLNVTTDVQKRGIADYFDPTIASKSNSGAGGVLGGQTIGSAGQRSRRHVAAQFRHQPLLRCASRSTATTSTTAAAPTSDQSDDGAPQSQTEKPKKLTAEELQKQLAETRAEALRGGEGRVAAGDEGSA